MLKSNLTNVKNPVWNLMMKIFIRFPSHQVKQEDFRFNILIQTRLPLNYIIEDAAASFPPNPTPGNQWQRPLLKVFNLDKQLYNDRKLEVMVF
jgi:cell surface protein SprA